MGEMDEGAVWARVTAGAAPEGMAGGLLAAIESQQTAARTYRALQTAAGGEIQRTLRHLSRQAQGQVRVLSALYYYLTGQRPALSPPAAGRGRESLAEGLRRQMQQEELAAGRLEALGERAGGQLRETLLGQWAKTRGRFGTLLTLLGQTLESDRAGV